jgi:hypothetical protein
MKVVIVIALMGIALFPVGEALAQTAALSLAIPPTARANAMGEAYVALADDASAAWWNPAGLGFLPKKDISLTHSQLVPDLADDVYYDFLAFQLPVKGWGNFAASLVYLTYGESEARGPSGEDLGTFRSFEVAPVLSYGAVIANQVGVGLSFKYIRVELAPNLPNIPGSGEGTTVAVDLGVLWKIPGGLVNLGATLQNLGPNISFIAEDRSDPIYRNLKAGLAVNIFRKEGLSFIAVGDINQLLVQGDRPDGNNSYPKPIYNGGAELAYATADFTLALQGGYIHDNEGSISDPTYGLGAAYKFLRLGVASIPQAEDPSTGDKLDRVTKFSLGASF